MSDPFPMENQPQMDGITIPQQWRRIRLGELCKLVNGDAYKESDWSRTGIPIIRIQNLNDASKPFNFYEGGINGRVVVKSGDLLLAWSGTPGTSFGAHIWERGTGLLNQHIFRVDLTTASVLPKWAMFAINRELEILIGNAHGAVGLRHVTKGEVESLQILLPPIEEQKRIVARLTEKGVAAERARSEMVGQLAAAKRLAAAYLQETFTAPETERWENKSLAEIGELQPSKSITTVGDAKVQVATTACLTEFGFDPVGIKGASMWAKDVPYATLRANEILVARSNTPELVGRAALFTGSPIGVCASDLMIRLLVHPICRADFVSAYLSFLFVSGYWKERAGGASGSMKKITRTQIMNLKVPVPPLETQTRVAAHLAAKLGASQKLCCSIAETMETAAVIPNAFLQRAFDGEL